MTDPDAIVAYNRNAWDRQVDRGNRWTLPVGPEEVARARAGAWSIVLTPSIPVPADWFPPLTGAKVLCLAGGGGQQAPILAAAGATVTVFDNSPNQLARDREVAAREGLAIETVLGDMADLAVFDDGRFDLIVHPCSNTFVPDVKPVWREAYRVLRPGGELLAGFVNPLYFLFDDLAMDRGTLILKYRIPYSDLEQLDAETRKVFEERDEPLAFGHTLDDQIGGQLAAGFRIRGFYEDRARDTPLGDRIACFIATRAEKPAV